ncbi:PREDICTED: uncharacterized protein LOC104801435 [Tarenaya hassleriana]|uniref:uncharacterized protein LOC104801435 n=1 Tax=Tarenaya hassleriana TaxID=28532 RepID=UPI0008FD6A2D|nr:PREDICTED: uncharacterized protein LOC104801435 [Tarenaya hassleriana]
MECVKRALYKENPFQDLVVHSRKHTSLSFFFNKNLQIKSMEEPIKIMRRSIHTFLRNYHRFTTAAAASAFPFAVALLLSQPFSSSSSALSSLRTRLNTLFHAAGFPSFFDILSLKLSQTICSSVFALPFSLTFLLFSKAYVIRLLSNDKLSSSDVSLGDYLCLLRTYICNSFLLLSANASAFGLLFMAFNLLQGFGFSSQIFLGILSVSAAVVYSIILANALVISNLALVSSSSSSSSGYMAILKACVLIRGRTSTALALALPTNIGLAAVEALFQTRIVKSYFAGDRDIASLVPEGMLIAYLYAIFVILDTVVNFLFYQSCKTNLEEGYSFQIETFEPEFVKCVGSKGIQELP